jgi:DNA modification methylase
MSNCICQHCGKSFTYKAADLSAQQRCHRIVVGDSTRGEDVTRAMGGQKATLMATDPPYLVDYQGGNHPQSWSNRPEVRDKHWDDYHEGEASELFVQFLQVALNVALIDNPAIYQWHAYKRQALVESAWQQAGLLVHQQIVWVKSRAVLTHSHFMWQHEPCHYGWVKGKQPTKRPPPNITTVWQIDQKGLEGLHPTQKPLEILTRPIGYHTEPGDVIYEPFSGSGTALAAAEAMGRICCAIEKSEAFVAVALERLEQMGLKPRLNHDTPGR